MGEPCTTALLNLLLGHPDVLAVCGRTGWGKNDRCRDGVLFGS